MSRNRHDTYAGLVGLVYLLLATNALLVLSCLPLVVLLITTDPARSWPMLALALPLAAPGVTAAYRVFAEHTEGETVVVRRFLAAWRATAAPALRLVGLIDLALVILLTDVHLLAGSTAGVLLVPLIGVLVALCVGVGLVGLTAVAEAPRARLRDVVRVSAYLALRHWPLTLLSLLVLAVQAAVFASLPAIALGLTAAPSLYVAWTNSRHTLRRVLAAGAAS